ncbi:YoaK family protein [Niabella sp. CJ426]|uniref:YoaK family protein n=1 Tax=Niabella sp. CJ426 TaxID=3393740 RepID=UPI003D032E96
MFRHSGKTRTLNHNKKIASLLSFVAGVVNVAGFISVQRLTTNVTGHFAFFVDEVFKLQWSRSLVYFLYILFFFLGSFISSLLVEMIMRKNERFVYIIPGLFESLILLSVAMAGPYLVSGYADLIACSLLFAMGLQNSLVTRISGAMVRTTHLTGLFTDLGIEISQLFFYKRKEQKNKLLATIRLRLRIIAFFFLGGIAGGVLYTYFGFYALGVPAALLIGGLYYDGLKLQLIKLKRRHELRQEKYS